MKENFAYISYYYINFDEAHPSKGSHMTPFPLKDYNPFNITNKIINTLPIPFLEQCIQNIEACCSFEIQS
jgi:hypothetical protein